MRHLDLFSGIGGFALAAREVWGDDHEIVGFCDNDHFCQNVLAKNFPGVPIYGDIRELTAERLWKDLAQDVSEPQGSLESLTAAPALHPEPPNGASGTLKRQERRTENGLEGTEIGLSLTTEEGAPVVENRNQPSSLSTTKRTMETPNDEPTNHRHGKSLSSEVSPPIIKSYATTATTQRKNSEGVRIDLLTGGFPCQPFSNAGLKKGANDDRFLWPEMLRVIRETKPAWVIGENVAGIINMALDQVCADLENEGYEVQPFVIPACAVGAPHRRDRVWIVGRLTDTSRTGLEGQAPSAQGRTEHLGKGHDIWTRPESGGREDAPDPKGTERQQPRHSWARRPRPADRGDWNRDWREVALATCHDRMDDGLPKELVVLPDGTRISQARWRREALKAYGNAIVPQVAVEIMRAIKATP